MSSLVRSATICLLRRAGALGVLALLTAGSLPAQDWPWFRGSAREGTASSEGLLSSWGEAGPRELWRREIGAGYSSVSAVGNRLYTMVTEGDDEAVICIDAMSGETVWSTAIGPTGEAFPENGPRSTPTVAGDRLFTATSQGVVAALATRDGALIWKKDLAAWGPPPRFGYSTSPFLDGDLVIVEGGSEDSDGVYAFDRESGELAWSALEGPAGYSTPIAVEIAGVRQYVFFRRAKAEVVSLSTDGAVLWRFPTEGLAIIVSPVFVPPNKVFVATSDDVFGGLMLQVSRQDGAFDVSELWRERLMRTHFNAVVAVGGHLYGFDNSTLRCLDAETGEKLWAKRGFGKGSVVAAGDLLFVLADDGTLALAAADPDGYRELGRTQAMRGRSWTAPTVAHGRLYARDFDEMVSFDLRRAPAAASSAVASSAAAPSVAAAARAESPAGQAAERALAAVADLTAEQVVERYAAARGGAERWRKLESLRMTGTYSAFSEESPFTLLRQRGDFYRLEFSLFGAPAIRARDGQGAWGQHALVFPEAGRIDEGPYKTQFERESAFGPVLLDWKERGIVIERVGSGEINGRPTLDLAATFTDGQKETWHLDPETFLEVAVDSQVIDYTQLPEPMLQRAFYADFREVNGLVLPFRIDWEFNARLESMSVESAETDPRIEAARFSPPPPPAVAEGDAAPQG
jgi:outer membrane protein assembly factor BamB